MDSANTQEPGQNARVIGKLSTITVRNAKRRGLYGDGGGLFLQVSQGGTKSWVFRFKEAGRLRVMGGTSAPQWLQAGTKISPKNMTLREELIDDAIDCRCGNGKHAVTRPQDGHADDASLRVDEGATLSGPAEHKIYADEVIDSAAAKTVPGPSHGGDDAEASDRRTFVISNCQDNVTRAQRRRIGGRDRKRCRGQGEMKAHGAFPGFGVQDRGG